MLYNHLRINKHSPTSAWMHFYSTLRNFLWIVLYFLFCYIPPGVPTKSFLSIPMISLACTKRCLRYILNIKKEFTLEFQPSLKNVWFSYILTGLRDSSESGRNMMAHLHISLQWLIYTQILFNLCNSVVVSLQTEVALQFCFTNASLCWAVNSSVSIVKVLTEE